MEGTVAIWMFFALCLLLLLGYPVALTLAGTALAFAAGGIITGTFDSSYLIAFPGRLYGTITNVTLVAVPLFILMGITLEKSKIAEELLENMASAFGSVRGGLGISIVLVGMLLAASTGIVGATVVTMGLLSLPTMLRSGYSSSIATGTICATGTLGQIIPPSIALVLLGDIISSAYQQAQLSTETVNVKTVSVGDLFVGALIPGLLLVLLYLIYILLTAQLKPSSMPPARLQDFKLKNLVSGLLPPVSLMLIVLGSIIAGAATPTEAAGVGAIGALILAWLRKKLDLPKLQAVAISTMETTSMVFMILIGAALFSLVFRGFGGEDLIHTFLSNLGGGVMEATLIVMVVIFLLGFILDFIEITFLVVPIVGPVLLAMGLDPIWLGIMIAINLQTSFLTPPFGFALFYLRGVAPESVKTIDIYKGVIPFIIIQIGILIALWIWPSIATWLPNHLNP